MGRREKEKEREGEREGEEEHKRGIGYVWVRQFSGFDSCAIQMCRNLNTHTNGGVVRQVAHTSGRAIVQLGVR